jgi:hypothetical protein
VSFQLRISLGQGDRTLTAVDEVIINTPPSGLALNVGSASRKRWRFALTFVDQHWHRDDMRKLAGSTFSGWIAYLVPLVVG